MQAPIHIKVVSGEILLQFFAASVTLVDYEMRNTSIFDTVQGECKVILLLRSL